MQLQRNVVSAFSFPFNNDVTEGSINILFHLVEMEKYLSTSGQHVLKMCPGAACFNDNYMHVRKCVKLLLLVQRHM